MNIRQEISVDVVDKENLLSHSHYAKIRDIDREMGKLINKWVFSTKPVESNKGKCWVDITAWKNGSDMPEFFAQSIVDEGDLTSIKDFIRTSMNNAHKEFAIQLRKKSAHETLY